MGEHKRQHALFAGGLETAVRISSPHHNTRTHRNDAGYTQPNGRSTSTAQLEGSSARLDSGDWKSSAGEEKPIEGEDSQLEGDSVRVWGERRGESTVVVERVRRAVRSRIVRVKSTLRVLRLD